MFGISAILRAQMVLVVEVLLTVALGASIYLIKRRPRPQRAGHCRGMTATLIAQTVVFLLAMAPSLRGLPLTGSPAITTAMLHGVVGLVSLALGWWVVLALRFKFRWPVTPTPRALRRPMQATAVTWVVALALGFLVYGLWYL